MDTRVIFERVFEVAESSKDQKGAVGACLVRDGHIILCQASSDDGVEHAEYRLIKNLSTSSITVLPTDILYLSLEPCSRRTPGGPGEVLGDCTTHIIDSGIKQVVFAVQDKEVVTRDTRERLTKAGIMYQWADDAEIAKRAREIFNNSCADPNGHI